MESSGLRSRWCVGMEGGLPAIARGVLPQPQVGLPSSPPARRAEERQGSHSWRSRPRRSRRSPTSHPESRFLCRAIPPADGALTSNCHSVAGIIKPFLAEELCRLDQRRLTLAQQGPSLLVPGFGGEDRDVAPACDLNPNPFPIYGGHRDFEMDAVFPGEDKAILAGPERVADVGREILARLDTLRLGELALNDLQGWLVDRLHQRNQGVAAGLPPRPPRMSSGSKSINPKSPCSRIRARSAGQRTPAVLSACCSLTSSS